MTRLSLDILTVMGMDPLSYIALAADLGCDAVGMQPAPVTRLPDLYPAWSLRDDRPLARDVKAALADRGVTLHLGEGFLLEPGMDPRIFAADIDLMAELGARTLNICSFDDQLPRLCEALTVFAELAARAGMTSCLEFAPALGVADLPTAAAVVGAIARPDFGLAIDAMHFFRSGARAADLAALDPGVIAYVQLCDAPLAATMDYVDEACFERRRPGEGELPLAELVAAVPAGVVFGLETPMRSRILGGESPAAALAPGVAAARRLIAARGYSGGLGG